jgi:hypothetical protein
LTVSSFDLKTAFHAQAKATSLGDKDLGARLRANSAALAVINEYLTALSAFANQDFQSELDADSTQLAASVKSFGSFEQRWAQHAAASSSYLATAIDGLGHAYIEHQRIAALQP